MLLLLAAACVCLVTSQDPPPPPRLGEVWNRTIGSDPVTFMDGLYAEKEGLCPRRQSGDPTSISRGSRLRGLNGEVPQTESQCAQACVDAGDNCLAARFVQVSNVNDRCWRYTEYACQPLELSIGCTFFLRVGCRSCQIAEGDSISNDAQRARCILPFWYNNQIYEECSTANVQLGETWCPTNSANFMPTEGYEYGLCEGENVCPGRDCIYDPMPNTLYLGGEFQEEARTNEACRDLCNNPPEEDDVCYGYDYTSGDDCFLHLSQLQNSRRRDNADDVTHYTKIECPGESSPSPGGSTTPRDCVDSFRELDNTGLYSGTEQPSSVNGEADCREACLDDDECLAFNIRKVEGTCWLVLTGTPDDLPSFDDNALRSYIRNVGSCLLSPSPSPDGDCTDTFIIRVNQRAFGGREVSRELADSALECQDFCLDEPTCRSIDFNYLSTGARCYWFDEEEDDLPLFDTDQNDRIDHFIRQDCSGIQLSSTMTPSGSPCVDTFERIPNMGAQGGVGESGGSTLTLCEEFCLEDDDCVGFDYVEDNPSTQRCYLHLDIDNINERRYDSNQVDLYVREECVSTMTPPVSGPPGTCEDTFEATEDQNSRGGVYESSGTTRALCEEACLELNIEMCAGFDWDVANVQKCWLHAEDTIENTFDAPGVTQYRRVACSPLQDCLNDFRQFPNFQLRGADTPTADRTKEACQESCIQRQACQGFNFAAGQPNTLRCSLVTDPDSDGSVFPNSGVDAYLRRSAEDCANIADTSTRPTGPGECEDQFFEAAGTQSFGGREIQNANSEELCKEVCREGTAGDSWRRFSDSQQDVFIFDDNDCLGFDLGTFANGVIGCWVHTDPQRFNEKVTGASNVVQFTRIPCELSTTSEASSQTPPDCVETIEYTEHVDRHSPGGVRHGSLSSVDDCKAFCEGNDTCFGFDFDRRNSRCFFHFNEESLETRPVFVGVTQYVISRSCETVRECTNHPHSDRNCEIWSRNQGCETLRDWMFENCYKTCSGCDEDATEPPGTCDGPYRVVEDMYAPGGTGYTADRSATLSECKEACEGKQGLPACVGFDYSSSRSPTCTHHFNEDNVEAGDRRSRTGTDHYVFDDRCDERPPICDGPFEIFVDVYAQSGTPYTEVPEATLDECKEACISTQLCVAFDYSQARTPFCWRHFNEDNLDNVRDLTANNHYRFNEDCSPRPTPDPECLGEYFEFLDTSAIGARGDASITDLQSCLRACERNTDCTAVDYNAAGNTRCWLHESDVSDSRRSSTGVNHYQLVRRCDEPIIPGLICDPPSACACPSTQEYRECGSACTATCELQNQPCTLQCVERCQCPSSAPILSSDGMTCITALQCQTGCVDEFVLAEDMNAFGGMEVPNANTLDECQTACSSNTACLAVDYDEGGAQGFRCFMHSEQDNIDNLNSAPGVDHYVINRICAGSSITPPLSTPSSTPPAPPGSCDGPYRVFTNIYADGGVPFNQNRQASLSVCRQACDNNPACLGFEYQQSRRPTCYHHDDEDDFISVVTRTGNMHYRFDSSCGSRPTMSTESTIEPCDTFEMFGDSSVPGGDFEGTFDLDECQQRCIDNADCVALDYVPGTRACWFHDSDSNLDNRGQNNRVDHYQLTRCGETTTTTITTTTTDDGTCEDVFVLFPDRRANGASRIPGSFTSTQCEERCVANVPECFAIDYVRGSGQCWLHTSRVDQNDLIDDDDVDHYQLVGRCDQLCTVNVIPYANSAGGSAQSHDTAEECFMECVGTESCAGADFDILRNECFFHSEQSVENERFSDCCYRMVKSCTSCEPRTVRVDNRRATSGGTHIEDANTVQECQQACFNSNGCEVFEFNSGIDRCNIFLNLPISDFTTDNSYDLYRRGRCFESINDVPYL